MDRDTIIFYIACGLVVVGTLTGIGMMSRVKTAVLGNKIGAFSIFFAIALTLWYHEILDIVPLLIVMFVSLVLSVLWSTKIKMIAMPQTVALLNGLGGAASAIVGGVYLMNRLVTPHIPGMRVLPAINEGEMIFTAVTSGLAIAVGMMTLFGSLVAVGKLSGRLNQKPVVLPGHQFITTILMLLSLAMVAGVAWSGVDLRITLPIIFIVSSLFGVVFAIRIGGADMPITISLLNSLTGVALAAAGMSVGDPMLIAVGGIVGAAGLLLTQIMCRGMNRSLLDILMGKTTVAVSGGKGKAALGGVSGGSANGVSAASADPKVLEAVAVLKAASKVLVIPGYGMALAQAQGVLKSLTETLEENGAIVEFTIHPVAGRTAGHMNVLLADADVPYEKLREARDLDVEKEQYDVALVVGANDVVNPAARNAVGTPIYGLPIIAADKAKRVIICNLDAKPGYAGVENPLYKNDSAILLAGNAADTLDVLNEKLGESGRVRDASQEAIRAGELLSDAKNVIIIPGYGMALAQAQGLVKELSDKLEKKGAVVNFAIHPVAGRMPGHMNVLLAEADVSYDKLREMHDINSEFAGCDVAVIVGANDVVNPAARNAEGTPIYGMPILSADEAKNIIVCNYDNKPGYAGVDNPLYTSDNVTLLFWGCGKDAEGFDCKGLEG